jgi:hypothetical protein
VTLRRCPSRGIRLALALILLSGPAAAWGQTTGVIETTPPGRPRIPGPRPINPVLLGVDAPLPDELPTADTLLCLQCDPGKHFWFAVGDLLLAQFVPFLVSNYVTNEEWARVSPQTWANNISYPWQWDDNAFQNNQWGHPYQGSLYFNAARTNGYNFWASAAWPLAGSLMWEYFYEAWAPAPNDVVNTAVGGVILGESFNRLSNLVLDNTATGKERTWREIFGAVLNPVGGLNRLIRGQTHEHSANPPEWRPSAILGVIDFGYRRTLQSIGSGEIEVGSNQWNASLLLSYGDPYKDLARHPFSYFAIRADLAGPGYEGLVNQFSVRGSLAAWPLDQRGHNQVALSMEYDYFNNPAFEYGGQSVQAGLVTNIGTPGKKWWGQTSVLANGVLLGAVRSDYYRTIEGRDYDYGPGGGPILSGRILYRNQFQGTVGYTGLWLHTIDGTESSHYQDALLIETRYWASRTWGLGFSYVGYTRDSYYRDHPDVAESARFLRFFITTAVPGLPMP